MNKSPIRLVRYKKRCRRQLAFELLESRELLATFTVITTSDSGTGSLRDAIDLANNTPGADRIEFAIPETDPGFTPSAGDVPGFWTIKPSEPLPEIRRDPTTPL